MGRFEKRYAFCIGINNCYWQLIYNLPELKGWLYEMGGLCNATSLKKVYLLVRYGLPSGSLRWWV